MCRSPTLASMRTARSARLLVSISDPKARGPRRSMAPASPFQCMGRSDMAKFHWNVDQGSLEWHKLRSGIPTASMFDKIITPKKMDLSEQRKEYACRLITERMLNWQPDSISHLEHVAAGKENEPLAIKKFEFVTDTKSRPVGFVTTNDGRFGASPDRVLGYTADMPEPIAVSAIAEVKCPTPPIQMRRILFGDEEDLPYRCQVQGQLFVTEGDTNLFYSFHPQMPDYLRVTGRDDTFIATLSYRLDEFSIELERWIARALEAGPYQAFKEILSPVEAERSAQMEAARKIEEQLGWQ